MLNEKADKFLYWDCPLNFRLFSFFVGEDHHVFTRIGLFSIVKDSPFCQRWPFGIANDVRYSKIFMR